MGPGLEMPLGSRGSGAGPPSLHSSRVGNKIAIYLSLGAPIRWEHHEKEAIH